MTLTPILGSGVLYLTDVFLLGFGLTGLYKRYKKIFWFFIAWILIGLIPASLTNNEQSAGRTILILPALIGILSFGVWEMFLYIKAKTILFKSLALILFAFFIVCLVQVFLVFSSHFPYQRGEAFMEGTKESVLFALKNQENYQEIVFDPYRGIDTGDIVNVPHLYILFYASYDPALYQKEQKNFTKDGAHFGKFTIRRINWREKADREVKQTLFVGSPWGLPLKDLEESQILEKIYLKNGRLALIVVSSNK